MSRFENKRIIVTGGASGIGASTALAFAREGGAIAVVDLDQPKAETVAERIRAAGGHAVALAVDVADEEAVAGMITEAESSLGGLDILVNNAGIGEDPDPIESKTRETWQRILDVNLSSAFFGTKHAAAHWKEKGTGGVIVNVASILGVVGFAHAPAYTAAKHGLVGFTKAAALELAPAGIRVVCVNPAFIRTPLIEGMEEAVLPLHPIGRLGESDEVASMILYLSSEEAGFLTGASYLIDGGYTAP